jgi:hypothetical protein
MPLLRQQVYMAERHTMPSGCLHQGHLSCTTASTLVGWEALLLLLLLLLGAGVGCST